MSSVSETLRIGSDHVIVQSDRLVVISRAHMDGWQVRTYRPTLIRFAERDWRVAETRVVPPDATQYTLVPWDRSEQDVIGQTIDYGPAFVEERDRALIQARKSSRVTGMLRVVAPFTGFLSGRIKNWLEVTYGLDSVATTKQSVIIQTMATIAALAAIQVLTIATTLRPFPFLFGALLFLLDAAVRWHRVLDEQRPPPGLFEWVFTVRMRSRHGGP